MPDTGYTLETPMAVERLDSGHVVAWCESTDGQVALFMSPGAADETGRRLRETARGGAGATIPVGHIAGVDIHPPEVATEAADIVLRMTDGQEVTLTMHLRDLVGLAQTAQAALEAVEPEGRS